MVWSPGGVVRQSLFVDYFSLMNIIIFIRIVLFLGVCGFASLVVTVTFTYLLESFLSAFFTYSFVTFARHCAEFDDYRYQQS